MAAPSSSPVHFDEAIGPANDVQIAENRGMLNKDHCVIIQGLAESSASSPRERIAADLEQFQKLLNEMLQPTEDVTVLKAFRLAWNYSIDPQKHWAVLVAGSNGWWNYRHQADISHAYQILLRNGFLEDHIIVFMYDDIAHNHHNPFPGKIFNDYSHTDVYQGVKIDFKQENVTVKNFLDVLLGKASKDGQPYLNTGPEDYVFINLVDHGAPGLFCFPEEEMFADDFIDALRKMHQNKRYKQMAIYVEACESGSLFENLLRNDSNILGVTAATSQESSYACFCDDPSIDSCLGDEFSVNWMQFLANTTLPNTNIREMVEEVRKETKMSTVCVFGEEAREEIISKFDELIQFILLTSTKNLRFPDDIAPLTYDTMSCYKNAVKTYLDNCVSDRQTAISSVDLRKFNALCSQGVDSTQLRTQITEFCSYREECLLTAALFLVTAFLSLLFMYSVRMCFFKNVL
nr:unnamed protein product [Spirometra erinaceieuropaei]